MYKMSDGKTSSVAKLTQKSKNFPQVDHVFCCYSHVGTIGTRAIGTIARKDKARCARMER